MKINLVDPKKDGGKNDKGSFWLNLYYFFMLNRFIAFLILGFAALAFVVILILDFTIPRELENIDRKTTMRIFDELQQSNKHQDAIVLMEYKGDLLKGCNDELEYKIKLSDSYIHVGDFSKAEKVLAEVWKLTQIKAKDVPEHMANFIKYANARVVYQLYEKMGDAKNQIKFFDTYKSYYKNCDFDKMISEVEEVEECNNSIISQVLSSGVTDNFFEYDSIVVISLTDQIKASEEMGRYIDRIIDKKEYGKSYKIKCMNKLIGWLLQQGKLPEAYLRISQAVDLAQQMRSYDCQDVLGDLSDYCYEIHDVELSKFFYQKYQEYLDENGQKTDDEYLKNTARSFRYLESEGKWKELIDNLTTYCSGMRKQISINLPTMNEEQRDYFAEKFESPYYYALKLLRVHPCEELAKLCFDNITFKNGLLLRSNASIENSIKQIGDKDAQNKYEELKRCRRELIYQSVSGRKLFTNKGQLTDKINQLEKELALASIDFKTKNQTIEYRSEMIQKAMKTNTALVDIIENKGDLFALVLQKQKPVTYVPLGNLSDIEEKLMAPIREIYHDNNLTKYLWSKIDSVLLDCTDVYYVPIGVFTQISLGSLYLGNNEYLCDRKNIKLISNPADIIEENSLYLTNNMTQASLWGGIDYGIGEYESSSIATSRSAIKRGEYLHNLRYTSLEVDSISSMLSKHNIKKIVFKSVSATEKAFKDRDGKGDYIIHISTHGFFNDTVALQESMFQSGLFFAGANRYWSNDTLECAPGQEDGILRAAEISTLNLSGCNLVVLSACETGLGFSDSSEGVYGLQRAFKLAGARQILMSLWDVDDRATTILMTEFYKNLLDGKTTDEALEISKKKVRNDYPSPEVWGAFVLMH